MLKENLIMAGEVDLPTMSDKVISKLLKWHDSNKKLLENRGAAALYHPWVHTKIRDTDEMDSVELPNTTPGAPWNKEFVELFPELIEFFNILPLKSIGRIILLETVKPCTPHIDLSSMYYTDITLEPCNYRMTLRASNSNGFYVQAIPAEEFGQGPRRDKTSVFQKEHFKPRLGHWWVLNNWCCQHGSDWEEGDSKVLISIQGEPKDQHRELLKTISNSVFHPTANFS